MLEKVLTEEGLLAPATTSNDDLLARHWRNGGQCWRIETNDEGNNLSERDPEPGQRSPREAQKKKEKKENGRGTTSYNQK